MRRLVEEARTRANTILTERRSELELLTKALMEYETLTKEEMEKVLRGEKLEKLENIEKLEPAPAPSPLKLPDVLQQAPGFNGGGRGGGKPAEGNDNAAE